VITISIYFEKQTVKDYVPVDSESVTHNMWVLMMFRSVMVHTKGIIEFLGRTIFLKPTESIVIPTCYVSSVIIMVVLYDKSFSLLFVS
jgi:hypothetical protein